MSRSIMDTHTANVETIRTRIEQFYKTKIPFRIYHGSTNSTRHVDFDRNTIVDVSGLNSIISINIEEQTVLVEPNVPMDVLVDKTMESGLLPPVVMEFPGITVGGGFVGTAGESSSFKYGFFDRTVRSAEVVLADGSLVTASDSHNQELFEGLRGSFGTLGVLTMVEIKLLPLRKYVEVTYHPTGSLKDAMSKLQQHTLQNDNDYVDGILFSKSSGVVVTGKLTNSVSSPNFTLQRFSKPWNEWFWIHAKSLASEKTPTTEVVPIKDYLFRYDRGAFWMGMYAYKQFMFPFVWLTRFLFDYFMHTRIMYHALHASGYTDRFIIQDVAVPAENADRFVEYVDHTLGVYPLWLCPLRKDARSSMGHPQEYYTPTHGKQATTKYEGIYISVGVWGPCSSSKPEYVRENRSLEAKIHDLGGLKWLYSRVFYTEDEWWQSYDRQKYTILRDKFNATSLPSIWEKVKDRGRKDEFGAGMKGLLKRSLRKSTILSGIYGVWKATKGGDYLLKRKRS